MIRFVRFLKSYVSCARVSQIQKLDHILIESFWMAGEALQQSWISSALEIPDRADEGVYIFAGVVQRQRRTHGAFDSEAAKNRLGAMMAGTNGDAFLIQRGADIFRAKTIEDERKHA